MASSRVLNSGWRTILRGLMFVDDAEMFVAWEAILDAKKDDAIQGT